MRLPHPPVTPSTAPTRLPRLLSPHVPPLCIAAPAPTRADDAADKAWRLGFKDVRDEFVTPVQLQSDGRVPADLDVTFFRNGPGRFEGEDHWVDGQGFLVKLGIAHGGVTYQSRFIETAEHRIEQQAAGRKGRAGIERLFGRYGSPLPHGLWTVMRGRWFKNPANTSILHHAQRLLALGDGGAPERIDPHTLASLGTDRLGALKPRGVFSPHPKLDPQTGVMWNFGIDYEVCAKGLRARLRLYRGDPDGTVTTHCQTVLPFAGAAHDFLLTPTRAIVVVSPSAFPAMPMDWLMGKSTLGRSMKWRPELGTRIGVIDLKTGTTRWHKTHPMATQHTVNAQDDGDAVVFDVCDDDGPERWLRWFDVLKGDVYPRRMPRLRRFRVSPADGVESLYHPVAELEFPAVDPRFATRAHTRVFGLAWDERQPFFGIPCKVDLNSGQRSYAALGSGEYAGEPVLVNKKGRHAEGDVWLLTMVMCTEKVRRNGVEWPAGRSELQIFDGSHLERGPVSRTVLPQVVPYGFHGTAVPNSALTPQTT